LKEAGNKTRCYSPARKAVHRAAFLLCVAQFSTGWAIASSHLGHVGLAQRTWSVFVHRSHPLAGATAVVLVIVGAFLRPFEGQVPPASQTETWMRHAATIMHLLNGLLFLALSAAGFVAMHLSRNLTRRAGMLTR